MRAKVTELVSIKADRVILKCEVENVSIPFYVGFTALSDPLAFKRVMTWIDQGLLTTDHFVEIKNAIGVMADQVLLSRVMVLLAYDIQAHKEIFGHNYGDETLPPENIDSEGRFKLSDQDKKILANAHPSFEDGV